MKRLNLYHSGTVALTLSLSLVAGFGVHTTASADTVADSGLIESFDLSGDTGTDTTISEKHSSFNFGTMLLGLPILGLAFGMAGGGSHGGGGDALVSRTVPTTSPQSGSGTSNTVGGNGGNAPVPPLVLTPPIPPATIINPVLPPDTNSGYAGSSTHANSGTGGTGAGSNTNGSAGSGSTAGTGSTGTGGSSGGLGIGTGGHSGVLPPIALAPPVDPTPSVPEPSVLPVGLLMLGSGGAMWIRRRRK